MRVHSARFVLAGESSSIQMKRGEFVFYETHE